MEESVVEATQKINGTIEKITYRNEQNGYTVAIIRNGAERITVVGIFPFLVEGDTAEFSGRYIIHPSYGRQFSADGFERVAPQSLAAILRYLSSGIIKGVGPSTANKVVEKFGEDTLDVIQNNPEKLALIKGISIEKAKFISEEYNKQYGVRNIMLLLAPYEVSPESAVRIFKYLGGEAQAELKENPYLLCDEAIGFSFEKVERIAYDFGISPDNELRLMAGIKYILSANLLNGHTCLPQKKLASVAVKLLESDIYRIDSVCDKMVKNLQISRTNIDGESYIALNDYLAAEEYIAARLCAMNRNVSGFGDVDDLEIDYVENKTSIKFEDVQRKAIHSAFQNGLVLLTGGPGTGKTTTLNAIIELLEMRDIDIQLAAPTGRAAKRMTELTGRPAKTLHRLLEVEWGRDDKQHFVRNERNPLDCDVIIVDEASMIDSLLFESLLRALKLSCRVILVGDVDQLPSVLAGNILNDVIASNKFCTVRLKKVFRQSQDSLILTNAHAIINGDPIDFSNKGKDFFILNKQTDYDVLNTVIELCTERLKNTYGFDPLCDIQVLCPSRKLVNGTQNLNNILQSHLNPNSDGYNQLSYKGVHMRKNDKVMQIKNNYDIEWIKDNGEQGIGVFNGDVGFITELDKRAGIIKVRFDDRIATYYGEEIGELELAYAVTVHKSQGSEFDCVILPLFDVPSQLRYRNLLYTAVTRAKKMLVVVGSKAIFNQMAENDRKTLRYTMLKEFLNENS